ncbi:MAG: oxygen-independent coproporphyrinogen III oxidase [Alphaproteobacteria bacterium]|nr:oxygen-independent coproporphyrinogen III oxidase [Alphaproteobacteria bacterium]MDE2041972.1 oxygen-independent coproporphyrinogen III oxidase [Alphaproteobacteria bacterium]MDE2340319.1 oxygen-independent coproporphyrinogen III oxidase [Alphaproteobacteria bacterium]
MWPYYPDLLARAVPRYTSYPTAAEFGTDVGVAEQRSALESAQGPISLYAHIPYCSQLCWYCGCNTGTVGNGARLATYLEALTQEIALVSALLPHGSHIGRIAFGGGSPNALTPIQFARLLDQLVVAFRAHAPQISIEIDPRDFSPDWAATLKGAGVSHASLGVQTFAPHIQAAIGRVQPTAQVESVVAMLREAGVRSLNFDLMYGLPGQTPDDLQDSLARTIALRADRIALFGYAHVPHLIPRQRLIKADALPDQQARFMMAAFGYDVLTRAGYVPIGFDHFALPDDPLALVTQQGVLRRNFQGFTEDQAETLIGLGASSISQFPDRIIQNEKNAGRYRMRVSSGQLAGNGGVLRSADDRVRGAVITDILCGRPAELAPYLSRTVEEGLAPFLARGVARLEGTTLHPNADTAPYARSIASLLDVYRAQAPQRFSSAI